MRSIPNRLICAFAIACTILSAQDPLPEFYGVYALQDGKLIELSADPNLNDFSPTVRFVLYLRGTAQPLSKIFFLPADKPKDIGSKEFKGWDEFYRQSQEFGAALDMQLQYGVPANASEVPYRVGPYGGNSEMMRVVPVKELPPGYYQLLRDVRFWVRRAEVQQFYSQAATTQRTVGNAGTGSANQPPNEVPKSSTYPISSGLGVTTKFGIRNETFRTIQVFLDGSDTPIVVRVNYQTQLEVGSTHIIKVVVGNQTFQARFTVPRVMRDIAVTTRGIEVQ